MRPGPSYYRADMGWPRNHKARDQGLRPKELLTQGLRARNSLGMGLCSRARGSSGGFSQVSRVGWNKTIPIYFPQLRKSLTKTNTALCNTKLVCIFSFVSWAPWAGPSPLDKPKSNASQES